MSAATTSVTAAEVLATLRAHKRELRVAGIRRLPLFGSAARGDAEPDSDVTSPPNWTRPPASSWPTLRTPAQTPFDP